VFGLDEAIAGLAGGGPLVVLAVALLLGLRHASDPDHLVAVSTLVASETDRPGQRATTLGLSWGLGHAAALIAFGLPVILFNGYLPDGAQRIAEALVGIVIVALSLRLLARWRRGRFHAHLHAHGSVRHRHLHAHESQAHEHVHPPLRSPAEAFGIGCLHGIGGSAAVGVLLLASIPGDLEAVGALVLFALATAVSMAILSSGIGYVLASRSVERGFARIAPLLATASLVFGGWYAAGAFF
jgi:ABC-type nickel/cobalt efflux system permease component RcnA